MTKARLIKRHEAEEAIKRRRARRKTALQPARKPVETMREWVEQQRAARPDPRQAFAALFAQPQN